MLKTLKVYNDFNFLSEFSDLNIKIFNDDPPKFLNNILETGYNQSIILLFSGGDYDYHNRSIPLLEVELEYFRRTHKLKNLYFVISWQPIPKEIQEKFQNLIKFYFVPSMYAWYSMQNLITRQEFDLNRRIITKTFLSLNNRASWYRHALFYVFVANNLLDQSYVSYLMEDRFGQGRDETFSSADEFTKGWLDEYLPNINVEQIKSMIPYRPNFDKLKYPQSDWGIGHPKFYADTFCSVVTETYTNSDTDLPFFTEKIFKPIMFKQPFLGFCTHNSLKLLHDLGFKTFGDVFDESYDQLVDDQHRFIALTKEILRISTWSTDECQKVTRHLTPILEHNYQHMTQTLPAMFTKQIENIKQDICATIREKRALLG